LKGGGLGAGVQVSAMGGHYYGSFTYMYEAFKRLNTVVTHSEAEIDK